MPKEKRSRIGSHQHSMKLSKRHFAVEDNAVKHVDFAQIDASILKSMAEEDQPRIASKKKEKQALKHELFMRRLEASRSPYSKSHERRLKRKAKEQVAGGMSDIEAAISAIDNEIPLSVIQSTTEGASEFVASHAKSRPQTGQIGEGKGVPLSKNQRKRALKLERMRIPMILSTPEFASNPFQTIRTHAQNTLLKHEPPQ